MKNPKVLTVKGIRSVDAPGYRRHLKRRMAKARRRAKWLSGSMSRDCVSGYGN